jgi:hypothetical protein
MACIAGRSVGSASGAIVMSDEFTFDDVRMRRSLVEMDEAFCAAMFKAIDAGQECPPTTICTEPGTRSPVIVPVH